MSHGATLFLGLILGVLGVRAYDWLYWKFDRSWGRMMRNRKANRRFEALHASEDAQRAIYRIEADARLEDDLYDRAEKHGVTSAL